MLPTNDFIAALKFASHAMGVKDKREYLNGVLFRFVGDVLTLVATDGHRLALVRLNLPGCSLHGDYIVKVWSVKAVLSAVKTKQTDGSQVTLGQPPDESNKILLTTEQAVYTLDVHDGQYPDFERALPKTEPTGCPTIGISAGYLADAARALKLLAAGAFNGLKLETWDNATCVRLTAVYSAGNFPSFAEAPVAIIMPMRM